MLRLGDSEPAVLQHLRSTKAARFALCRIHPDFSERIHSGVRPAIIGNGGQTRDYTFVANAVHANLLAGSAARPLRGEMVKVACGTRFSLLQLLQSMLEVIRLPADPEFRPCRIGDVCDSEVDIRLAGELLDYKVVVPFMDGLRATLESSAHRALGAR